MRNVMTSRQTIAMHLLFAITAVTACGGAETADEAVEPTDAPTATEAAPNTLTEQEIAEGWQLLFDGASTTGWRAYNQPSFPESRWEVRDGALVVLATGDPEAMTGGDIVSEAEFGSFDLRFDFVVSAGANSGVFYFVQEIEGSPIWHFAPEYQLLDDPAYTDGEWESATHLTGENYDVQASSARPLRPQGEWNTGRILVDGTHVEHWLNGEKMVEYEVRSPEWAALVAESKFSDYPEYGMAETGRIALQDHGAEVWFRNIKIRRLDES